MGADGNCLEPEAATTAISELHQRAIEYQSLSEKSDDDGDDLDDWNRSARPEMTNKAPRQQTGAFLCSRQEKYDFFTQSGPDTTTFCDRNRRMAGFS